MVEGISNASRIRGDRPDGDPVSSRLYISVAERIQPHVPKPTEIKQALGRLTPEERLYILQRARMLSNYSKAVEEALGTPK